MGLKRVSDNMIAARRRTKLLKIVPPANHGDEEITRLERTDKPVADRDTP